MPPTATHTSAGQGTARSSGDGRSARSFTVVKHNGKLALTAPVAYKQFVDTLGEGEELTMTLRSPKKTRSYDQLRFWFGCPMKLLSEHTGYTKLQCHYMCLALCFGVVVDAVTGLAVPVVPASKHLSTKEMSDLIEWVGPWAFETHGLTIPLPNQVDLSTLPGIDDEAA